MLTSTDVIVIKLFQLLIPVTNLTLLCTVHLEIAIRPSSYHDLITILIIIIIILGIRIRMRIRFRLIA